MFLCFHLFIPFLLLVALDEDWTAEEGDVIKDGRLIFDSSEEGSAEHLAPVNAMDTSVVIVAWTMPLGNYFKASLETMKARVYTVTCSIFQL